MERAISERIYTTQEYHLQLWKAKQKQEQGKIVYLVPRTQTTEELEETALEVLMDKTGSVVTGLVIIGLLIMIVAQVCIRLGWL